MEKEIKTERLWKRLFGEKDEATFRHFSKKSFKELVEILEKIDTGVEWEANKAANTIIIWKPKESSSSLDFLLLLSMLMNKENELYKLWRKAKRNKK